MVKIESGSGSMTETIISLVPWWSMKGLFVAVDNLNGSQADQVDYLDIYLFYLYRRLGLRSSQA